MLQFTKIHGHPEAIPFAKVRCDTVEDARMVASLFTKAGFGVTLIEERSFDASFVAYRVPPAKPACANCGRSEIIHTMVVETGTCREQTVHFCCDACADRWCEKELQATGLIRVLSRPD